MGGNEFNEAEWSILVGHCHAMERCMTTMTHTDWVVCPAQGFWLPFLDCMGCPTPVGSALRTTQGVVVSCGHTEQQTEFRGLMQRRGDVFLHSVWTKEQLLAHPDLGVSENGSSLEQGRGRNGQQLIVVKRAAVDRRGTAVGFHRRGQVFRRRGVWES